MKPLLQFLFPALLLLFACCLHAQTGMHDEGAVIVVTTDLVPDSLHPADVPGQSTLFRAAADAGANMSVQLRNGTRSIGHKWLRGQALVQGSEAVSLGILLSMPEDVTHWTGGYMASAKKNLKRAWTSAPVIDHDDWYINYITHPYAGSLYYNALRSQGAGRLPSFLFATFQSTMWEYVFEAVAERPSIQDLIVTPIAGAALGEGVHRLTLRMGRNGFSLVEKIITVILNPMFVANNGFRLYRRQPGFKP
jgi:hypothetical protein